MAGERVQQQGGLNVNQPTMTVGMVEEFIKTSVNVLPTIPVVALKLIKLTKEGASLDELSHLIETDPAMTVKVLKIANSAYYCLRRKISSIKHAILQLGFDNICSIVLETALFENLHFRTNNPLFNKMFFWQHCLSVAYMSKALAEELDYHNQEEAYMAGLLHDIGKVILEAYGKVSYSNFIGTLTKSQGLIIDEELKFIGIGHDEIGAYFCTKWSFPESLVLAVKYHHSSFKHHGFNKKDSLLMAIVSLSDFIAWTQGIGSIDILRHPILHSDIDEFINIGKINLNALIKRMDNDVRGVAKFYGFAFPSSDIFRENLLRANISLSRLNTQYYYLQKELQQQIDAFTNMKKSITSPYRSLDAKEIINNTLRAVQLDFAFDRLYMLKVEEESRMLSVQDYVDTVAHGEVLAGLQIRITHQMEGLLACLRNKMPALITGINTAEAELLRTLNIKELGVVPVTSNDKLVGVICVDNIKSKRPIHIYELSPVAIVASELGMALEHANTFEKYKMKACIDALTQVYNRGTIEELLDYAFKEAKAKEIFDLSVGILDIDYFKRFNDMFGHLAGDSVLRLVAATMNKLSRPSDHVGRYGGEEFLFILECTDFMNALSYGERIRKEIGAVGEILEKRFHGHPLTVSIGIASIEKEMLKKEELIDKADLALYAAKNSGRNRVVGITGKRKMCPTI